MRINTNVSSINTYRNLAATDSRLTRSLERLSSGLRLNRAVDDPSGLTISEKMRAQVRGLNMTLRNALDGISLIQTTEGALIEVHGLLQRMRELAVQASSDTLSSSDRGDIQKEINQLVTEIDRIGNTTEFNTKKLLDGSTAALATTDKVGTRVFVRDSLRSVDQFGQKNPGGGNYRLEITAAPGSAQVQKSSIMRVKHGNITENVQMGWNRSAMMARVSAAFTAADAGDSLHFYFSFEDGVSRSVSLSISSAGATAEMLNAQLAAAVTDDRILNSRITVRSVLAAGTTGTPGFSAAATAGDFQIQSLQKGADGNFKLEVTRTTLNLSAGAGTFSLLSASQTSMYAHFTPEAILTGTANQTTGLVNTATLGDSQRVLSGFDQAPSGLQAFEAGGLAQGAYRITTEKEALIGAITAATTVSLVAQYRQDETAPRGSLLREMGYGADGDRVALSTAGHTAVNAQMAFEVTGINRVDPAQEYVTLKIRSWEMDLEGRRRYYESEETFNRQSTAIQTLTVGTVQFGSFNLAQVSASGTITVGDQFMLNIAPTAPAGTKGDLTSITRTMDSNGKVVSHTFTYYKNSGAWDNSVQVVDYLTLDQTKGGFEHSEIALHYDELASYTQQGGTATTLMRTPGAGELAALSVKLQEIEAFWDKSGSLMLASPQTITLVQGDGKSVDVTFFASDTVQDVVNKLNEAIASQTTGLGQEKITGLNHADKFVSYVGAGGKMDSGLQGVEGTFVIRSAIAGSYGKITFVGEEDFIKALGLTTIQEALENVFTVTVTDAHTNNTVTGANNVKIEGNLLVGKVHRHIDVEFDSMTGTQVSWDREAKNFRLTGGYEHKDTTYVHLADNTMVFQLGSNPLQDVGAAIGDMRAAALGIDKIIVTNREAASDAIVSIDGALGRVSGERSRLGSLQNRLEYTVRSLSVAAENLTAAESRIRDLSMVQEMMEYTRNQIIHQAGSAMLAQSNVKPQNMLFLLS